MENFFLHSCFINDPIVFFVTFLAPIFALILFNIVIFILSVRVLVTHTMKKKKSAKATIKTMISIVGIMVMFGLTWLFGALTVREASTAFQYLFVIFNGFQGFFFFIFNCLISKDGREFWTYVITSCCGLRNCTKYSSLSSKLGTSDPKRRTGSTSLGASNPNYRSRCMSGNGFSSSKLQSESNMRDRSSSSKLSFKSRHTKPQTSSTSFAICNPSFVPELLNPSGDDNGMEVQPENKLKNVDIELGVMLPRRASIIEESLLKEIEELLALHSRKQELEIGMTESGVEMETDMTQSDNLMNENMEANATQEEALPNEEMEINDLVIMNHAFDQGKEDLWVVPLDENSQPSEWDENDDDDCKILT